MAGVKAGIVDIIAKLATMTVTNGDGQAVSPFTGLWYKQTTKKNDGARDYDYPLPAFFVELVYPISFGLIGEGYRGAQVQYKIHIEHEYYNADGDLDQNLIIFDLRDKVIKLLQGFRPTGCGLLVATNESQSYEHTNVYEYEVEFTTDLVDDTGAKEYISGVATEAVINKTIQFIIPQ